MANETTSTTVTEIIQTEAIGAAAQWFDSNLGIADFVTIGDLTGRDTNTHVFPIIDQITAAAIAENTDYTTNSAVDTSGSASATVTEHIVKSTITDYSADATTENIQALASEASLMGSMFARAMQKLQDTDIAGLFGSFNSETGTTSGQLTSTLLSDAVSILDENNIPNSERVYVVHARTSKGFKPVLDNASEFGTQGQTILNTGGLGLLYGAGVFQTTSVQEGTHTMVTVKENACMHVSAVGLATKGGNMFEVERDASLRAAELVLVRKWAEVEYRGGATTNGRGGAGVRLYATAA